MKKTLLFIAVLLITFSTTAFSQDIKFGVGATYGDKTDFGIHGRALFELNDDIDLVGGFTFFLQNGMTMWQINADGHYTFSEKDDFSFYGLAGLNYSYIKVTGFTGNSEIGFDIGAGVEYKNFFGEAKFDTGMGDQFAITVGMYF